MMKRKTMKNLIMEKILILILNINRVKQVHKRITKKKLISF